MYTTAGPNNIVQLQVAVWNRIIGKKLSIIASGLLINKYQYDDLKTESSEEIHFSLQ